MSLSASERQWIGWVGLVAAATAATVVFLYVNFETKADYSQNRGEEIERLNRIEDKIGDLDRKLDHILENVRK